METDLDIEEYDIRNFIPLYPETCSLLYPSPLVPDSYDIKDNFETEKKSNSKLHKGNLGDKNNPNNKSECIGAEKYMCHKVDTNDYELQDKLRYSLLHPMSRSSQNNLQVDLKTKINRNTLNKVLDSCNENRQKILTPLKNSNFLECEQSLKPKTKLIVKNPLKQNTTQPDYIGNKKEILKSEKLRKNKISELEKDKQSLKISLKETAINTPKSAELVNSKSSKSTTVSLGSIHKETPFSKQIVKLPGYLQYHSKPERSISESAGKNISSDTLKTSVLVNGVKNNDIGLLKQGNIKTEPRLELVRNPNEDKKVGSELKTKLQMNGTVRHTTGLKEISSYEDQKTLKKPLDVSIRKEPMQFYREYTEDKFEIMHGTPEEFTTKLLLSPNLVKIEKNSNNEVVIYVPCRLNSDLECIFYFFSDNNIFLFPEQFAKMLHCAHLYHSSKPLDILERMFPSNDETEPGLVKKSISYSSFLKLLHRFALFKFKSMGISEEEKLNIVISFIINSKDGKRASEKLLKVGRCIQVNDPTLQRQTKNIQVVAETKEKKIGQTIETVGVGVEARVEVYDVSCECDLENQTSKCSASDTLEINSNNSLESEDNSKVESDHITEDESRLLCTDTKDSKEKIVYFNPDEYKSKHFISTEDSESYGDQPEFLSDIGKAITSIGSEDDKKIYRIFIYYVGPNKSKLSYRQFYNMMNDSGILGGFMEDFITPIQLERCYSAVLTDPKGIDYWEFKEVLLYCGETASCGDTPSTALQNIVKKYILPLILPIYQPNNFEKCEDAITIANSNKLNSRTLETLQTMINKTTLPWFRLGNCPFISSDESNSCSCDYSSYSDSTDSNESSYSSGSLKSL
ncbi:uncharacterized protein CMU_000550 [Cryptosporidium muris RN66]|uniref:Uncharacterized protein n=1 Tax=Cryptosporidium muris (strain RN66) TaxID=441375 RepID=B6AG44_CRYMR|nr:uncharacterized protein CMU_000550 [Cryptosporidium muris RN66]EEA07185.1 hypothetical protein, conserved [Cryptosporidium muris RN66]|eukprot:XP_002141534.1 hypothetical protein [Cryptosporidium muris RN66]